MDWETKVGVLKVTKEKLIDDICSYVLKTIEEDTGYISVELMEHDESGLTLFELYLDEDNLDSVDPEKFLKKNKYPGISFVVCIGAGGSYLDIYESGKKILNEQFEEDEDDDDLVQLSSDIWEKIKSKKSDIPELINFSYPLLDVTYKKAFIIEGGEFAEIPEEQIEEDLIVWGG